MAGMVSSIQANSVSRSSPILVHAAKITSKTAITTPMSPDSEHTQGHPRRGGEVPAAHPTLYEGPRHLGWPR